MLIKIPQLPHLTLLILLSLLTNFVNSSDLSPTNESDHTRNNLSTLNLDQMNTIFQSRITEMLPSTESVVPRVKVEAGLFISLFIFLFKLSTSLETIPLVITDIVLGIFSINVFEYYSGYRISLYPCKIIHVQYHLEDGTAPYSSWLMIPIIWWTEIAFFVLLPYVSKYISFAILFTFSFQFIYTWSSIPMNCKLFSRCIPFLSYEENSIHNNEV